MSAKARPTNRSQEWKAHYFASPMGRESAMRLAAVNQALHDAWAHMDVTRWSAAMDAVKFELADIGLPPDLRPSGVDYVIKDIIAERT